MAKVTTLIVISQSDAMAAPTLSWPPEQGEKTQMTPSPPTEIMLVRWSGVWQQANGGDGAAITLK